MVLKLVKDTLSKAEAIQGSKKAATAATALSRAAPIVKLVGNCVPGVGILGGAMGLCANALNPSAKLSHLKEESEKLRQFFDNSQLSTREHLRTAIEEVEERITTEMQTKLEKSLKDMSGDLKVIDKDLESIKNVSRETYGLVVDIRYKEGMEQIESTYQVFLNGSTNFKNTHTLLKNYIIELETKAGCSFTPENIEQYLNRVSKEKGKQEAKELATYVFIVRAKYLVLISAFYLYMNDKERVDNEFRAFEEDVEQLKTIHRRVLFEEFVPEVRPTMGTIKHHGVEHDDSCTKELTRSGHKETMVGASAYPTSALQQLDISDTGIKININVKTQSYEKHIF